jgi:putative hemolysin
MTEYYSLAAIIGLMLLSAFFSGVETGYYLMNAARVRLLSLRGDSLARMLSRMLDRPRLLIVSLLVGNNIANFAITTLATAAVSAVFAGTGTFEKVLITILLVNPLVLVFCEMLPKNLYRRRANSLMAASIRPLTFFYYLFLPISVIIAAFEEVFSFILGRRRGPKDDFWNLRNIEQHLTEAVEHGAISPRQNILAGNVLGLSEVRAYSVMTPLKTAALVNENATFGDCFNLAAKRRYSRYPVYSGKHANVIGFVNIFSPLFEAGKTREEIASMPIRDFIKKRVEIPENASADRALSILRANQAPMGIVANAKGESIGLVTTKDLVEEVVGELPVW